MSYRDENNKYRKPKQLDKAPTRNAKTRPFWAKRSLTWHKKQIFFDQEIKTGMCFFCYKEGRAQRSRITVLHHVKYDYQDPLEWTIEVCTKCHYHIDPYNKKIIQKHFAPRNFAQSVDREAQRVYSDRYWQARKAERMRR